MNYLNLLDAFYFPQLPFSNDLAVITAAPLIIQIVPAMRFFDGFTIRGFIKIKLIQIFFRLQIAPLHAGKYFRSIIDLFIMEMEDLNVANIFTAPKITSVCSGFFFSARNRFIKTVRPQQNDSFLIHLLMAAFGIGMKKDTFCCIPGLSIHSGLHRFSKRSCNLR